MQKLPTRTQLQRELSQKLQLIYCQQFGCFNSKISCYIFDKKLAIIVEDTNTKIENILQESSQLHLAANVRTVVEQKFINLIKPIIINILEVEVIDLISDSSPNDGILGILVFLNNPPTTRIMAKNKYLRIEIKSENAENNR